MSGHAVSRSTEQMGSGLLALELFWPTVSSCSTVFILGSWLWSCTLLSAVPVHVCHLRSKGENMGLRRNAVNHMDQLQLHCT